MILMSAFQMYNIRVRKQLVDSITSCLQFQTFQLEVSLERWKYEHRGERERKCQIEREDTELIYASYSL